MVPLYAARLSNLGPNDFLQAECACGHLERLTPAMLATAGVAPYTPVPDLKLRLKCRECRWKGRGVVSIKWVFASIRAASTVTRPQVHSIWYKAKMTTGAVTLGQIAGRLAMLDIACRPGKPQISDRIG
jgi:hypothetical protein